MKPRPHFAPIALVLLTTSGCAAARAGLQLQDAAAAQRVAIEKTADENAPYESTMAANYLTKAWEQMGRGEYKMVVTLAKKSAAWSDHAVVEMERGKRGIEVDLHSIDEVEAPAVIPDPTNDTEPKAPTSLEGEDVIELGKDPAEEQ